MFWSSVGQRTCVGLRYRFLCLTTRQIILSSPGCLQDESFCTSVPAQGEGVKPPVKRWTVAMSPMSSVRAQLTCNISVSPLDPHTFPEADRAILTVHGCGEQLERSLDHVRVHYDDQSSELLISADQVDHGVSVDLAAPINSDLFITTRGSGDVEVKKMECNVCKVQTERGNCLLHSIKGHQVEVQSNGGHVTAVGTIHGNVSIKTHGDSAVDVKKLQGTSMNVSTEHGPLSVKVIYSESSSISSSSGRIQLGHIQGNSVVKNVHGDTIIDGSNGSLNVSSHSGAIDVYVGDDSSANLHSHKGGVCVRVPSSLRAGVELRGASVEISPEVVLSEVETHTDHSQTTLKGYMNGASAAGQSIQAQTDTGSVTLRTQSWFDSLKLSQE